MASSRAVGQNPNDLGTNCHIGMHRAPSLTPVFSIPQGMCTYCTEVWAGEEARGRSGTRAGDSTLAPRSPLKQPLLLSGPEGRRRAVRWVG